MPGNGFGKIESRRDGRNETRLRRGCDMAALFSAVSKIEARPMPTHRYIFAGGAIGIFLQWLHRRHKTGGSGGGIVLDMRPRGAASVTGLI
jgi:hypothetical protein